jgi:hypothetical protein
VFYAVFGRNPNRVTCTCCGEDYSISGYADLAQATGYERHCEYVYRDAHGTEVGGEKAWQRDGLTGSYEDRMQTKYNSERRPSIPLDLYLTSGECKVVYANEITPEMLGVEPPEQGYVWVGD